MTDKKDTPRPEPGPKVRDIMRPKYDFVTTGSRIIKRMSCRLKSIYKPTLLNTTIEDEQYDTTVNCVMILPGDWHQYEESEMCISRVLYHISRRQHGDLILNNKISTQKERKTIITFGKMLSQIKKYQILSNQQIYTILIFCYYGMNLIEQYWDWLTFKHIKFYFCKDQVKIALDLIFDISARDIITVDGRNLASEIRRAFMGFDE